MMITTKTAHPASKMYYVGVPTEAFEEGFDEFEYVPDEQLPKEIDAVIVAAVESQEFTSRGCVKTPAVAERVECPGAIADHES